MAFTKILGPGISTDTDVQVGILTATKFYGDGSELDGITSAGLGTAVEAESVYGGQQIYYTNTVLGIGGTVTVDPPDSTNVAYTQYVDIAVDEDADLIIGDGDDLVLDILGIGTEGVGLLPGNGGRVRADTFTNKAGTGAPNFSYGIRIPVGYGLTGAGGINITGVVTATAFYGNFNGSVNYATTAGIATVSSTSSYATTAGIATVSQGLTGTPSITVGNISAQDIQVGGALTVTGNFTVNGTTTTIDTVNLVIEDKNIGIGTTSSASNTTADGAGFTIFGGAGGDKTLTWERGSSSFVYSDPNKFRGVIETVSAATTYNSGNNLVLELDVRNATTYTYTIPTGANIGIVSFKNMPAFTGNANGTTITCIFTQNAAGTGNTTGTTGIGTNCTVIGYENGAAVAGISTRALVGSGSTVTLSSTASDRDFVSFFVHYTGSTNTTATSYQVYVTKNGGFRQGNVGV